MFGKFCTALFVALLAFGGAPASAQTIGESGLPLPRFVTVNTSKANVRTGPGMKYAVEWVFVRHGMPVEIIDEYDSWRKIRDWTGTEGWVYGAMLIGKRGLVVTEDMASLYKEPSENSALLAKAEKGVIGRLKNCTENWCYAELGIHEGWMKRSSFWGTYADETVK